MRYSDFAKEIERDTYGDSAVVVLARIIINLARWPGSYIDWIEADREEQFAPDDWLPAHIPRIYPPPPPPERRLTREQGRALYAAQERAYAVLLNDPSLYEVFLASIIDLFDDDEEMTGRRILRTLDRLVQSGRVDIPQDPMDFAGFAYLFISHTRTGVLERLNRDGVLPP